MRLPGATRRRNGGHAPATSTKMKQDILFAVIVGAVMVGGIVYVGPAAALGTS